MKLKDYRNSLDLTCNQAGAQLGVDGSTFNRWENGDSIPEGVHLVALVKWTKGRVTAEEIIAEAKTRAEAKKAGGQP